MWFCTHNSKHQEMAAQYCGHIANKEKDAKLYIAKSNLNTDNTSGNSQGAL